VLKEIGQLSICIDQESVDRKLNKFIASIVYFMLKSNYNYKLTTNVFKTPWFSIEEIPHVSGAEKPYYSISCPDSVAVLAQTVAGEFILVSQFRPPQGQVTLELPSGYFPRDEDPLLAAGRELLEETGYSCEELVHLGFLKICPSRITNVIHAYCGFNARFTGKKQEHGIEVVLLSASAFEKYILTGLYNESVGIAMYFMSKEKKIFYEIP